MARLQYRLEAFHMRNRIHFSHPNQTYPFITIYIIKTTRYPNILQNLQYCRIKIMNYRNTNTHFKTMGPIAIFIKKTITKK